MYVDTNFLVGSYSNFLNLKDSYEVITEDQLLPSDLPPAQISLTDCLACSGCVTSAEAVLVSLQSHSEVLHTLDSAPSIKFENTAGTGTGLGGLDNNGRIYVASVSPQTRASIAATYGITERQAGYKIEQLLSGPEGLRKGGKHGNAFEWVVDTNTARDVCLVLGAEEVMESMSGKSEPAKPILTSSCPGWICYAEKTHPHVLPHLSRLKSPQALMGTLLKTTLSRKLGVSPNRIWHVAVMPCFDKKLEASREELTDTHWGNIDGTEKGIRDVDCVITSKELLMLADSRGIDFRALPSLPLSSSSTTKFPDPTLQSFLFPSLPAHNKQQNRAAGTSGGNLYYILQYLSSKNPGSTVQIARGRNADVMEYSVTSPTGEILIKAARYYGFRNIQNLVRRLKPARPSRMPGGRPVGAARRPGGKPAGPDYSYVEVMACPGGCTNGGGQIKVDDPVISGEPSEDVKPGPQEQKAWLAQVDEAYYSGEESDGEEGGVINTNDRDDMVNGVSPSYIKDTLSHWAAITGIDLDKLTYTTYRAVVSDVGKDKVGDTERVIELAGKIGGGW